MKKRHLKETNKKSVEYNPSKIEPKWQKIWDKTKAFKADDPVSFPRVPFVALAEEGKSAFVPRLSASLEKPKWYSLIEFPYPSGEGLHVGHVRSNTAMDIISRKRRMEGFNVLYPIGWDAFGLPTENYAIKTGIHPIKVTKRNTDIFRKQLKSIGFSFDWSREINTSDPAYYKWTQWIFLQLFKKGLAYKKKTEINWCLSCKIGLANEEVIQGKCERCGGPTEKREKEQWMLAITKYADRLDKDLDMVDYLPQIKSQQRNWIGKSEGSQIRFMIHDSGFKKEIGEVEVFTTRADTLFGVTYLVLAPENSVIENWKLKIENWNEVEQYIKKSKNTDQIERTSENREKTGVRLNGVTAINPANGEEVPIFIADYVLADYGTGAVMAVPAHDERDFAFAKKYNLPIEQVIAPIRIDSKNPPKAGKKTVTRKTIHALVRNPKDGKILCLKWKKQPWTGFIVGGVDDGEDIVSAARREVKEETGYKNLKFIKVLGGVVRGEYFAAHKNENRIAYSNAILFELENEDREQVSSDEFEKHEAVWLDPKTLNHNNFTCAELDIWFERMEKGDIAYTGNGILINSGKLNGMENMPIFVQKTGKSAWRQNEPEVLRPTVVCLIKHWSENKYLFLEKKADSDAGEGVIVAVAGGIEMGEGLEEAGKREIQEETGYKHIKFARDLEQSVIYRFYSVNGKQNRKAELKAAYFELIDGENEEISEHEKSLHKTIWLEENEIGKFLAGRPFSPIFWNSLKGNKDLKSGNFNGMESEKAIKAITEFVGGKMVTTYKLRDWVFSRQRYWGEPIPIVHCPKCGIAPVPEKDLPLKLPNVKNYKPTDSGESPLAAISKWVNVKCPVCKGKAKRETDTMPNWAGSSWYYLRYTDSKNKKVFADSKKLGYWLGGACPVRSLPTNVGKTTKGAEGVSCDEQNLTAISGRTSNGVDWYNGGMEHVTLHLLYSRFWHKFLFDLGLVPTSEPYKKRTAHGLVLAKGGEKMSKSKGNVVNPDDIVKTYGADTLRLYEMFMGPFDQAISWSEESIIGPRRFLEKVWRLFQKTQFQIPNFKSNPKSKIQNPKLEILLHKTIKKVGEDIEAMRFNTAVSSMMMLVNEMENAPEIEQEHYELFLKILSPFAPHIAEEIWQQISKNMRKSAVSSIFLEEWPKFDHSKIKEDGIRIAVQINGKVRGSFEASVGISEEEVKTKALSMPEIQKWINGAEIKKIIYVKNRLLSIVL